jgi:hypothetical protein
MAIALALGSSPVDAQDPAEWSRSPGMNSATLAADEQFELFGTAAGSDGGNLVVITHWKRRSDIGIDAALGGSHVLVRCIDTYDAAQSLIGSNCFVPVK